MSDFPTNKLGGRLSISPDGRTIIAAAFDDTSSEVWLLENFIPKRAVGR